MFNSNYKLKNSTLEKLTLIDKAKFIIDRAKISPKQEFKLRKEAIIRMTHSSTAIEGNTLFERQIAALYVNQKIYIHDRDVLEVIGYLNALKYINDIVKKKKLFSEKILLKIHKLVTNKILSKEESGLYRRAPVYIIKKAFGMIIEVIYQAPDFKDVPRLCNDLIEWIKKTKKEKINPIIVAGIVHQEIAAIHPFIDGNGRTARAVTTLILYQRGYDLRRIIALEDFYYNNLSEYYDAINIGKNYKSRKKDFTPWLEYFINGFKEEVDRAKSEINKLLRD